jgi:hypothetical protein
MKKHIAILLIIALFALNNSLTAQVIVKVSPASPKVVLVKPKKPAADMVWVAGHWHWSPRKQKYVWIEGKWIKTRRGHAYIAGHWKVVRGGYKWIPGHWIRV